MVRGNSFKAFFVALFFLTGCVERDRLYLAEPFGCSRAILNTSEYDTGFINGATNTACEEYGFAAQKFDDTSITVSVGSCRKELGLDTRACVKEVVHHKGHKNIYKYYITISEFQEDYYTLVYHEVMHVIMSKNGIPFSNHHSLMRKRGFCDSKDILLRTVC